MRLPIQRLRASSISEEGRFLSNDGIVFKWRRALCALQRFMLGSSGVQRRCCGTYGVAPSRAQLVDYALSATPGFVPLGTEIPFAYSFHDWSGKLRSRWGCEGGGSGLWEVQGTCFW